MKASGEQVRKAATRGTGKKAGSTSKRGKKASAPPPETPKPPKVLTPMERLSEQRRRFVRAYVLNGGNGAEAAREAGYSEKTARSQAHRLLTLDDVQEAVAAEAHRLAAKVEATVDRVVEELGYVGFANILHFCRIGDDGHPILDLTQIPEGASRAIQEITTETRTYFRGDVEHTVRKSKLKLAPKNQALDLIGRWLKMFVQRYEHAGPDGGPIPVEEQTSAEAMMAKVQEALDQIKKRRDAGREAIAGIPAEAIPGRSAPTPEPPADGGSGR